MNLEKQWFSDVGWEQDLDFAAESSTCKRLRHGTNNKGPTCIQSEVMTLPRPLPLILVDIYSSHNSFDIFKCMSSHSSFGMYIYI